MNILYSIYFKRIILAAQRNISNYLKKYLISQAVSRKKPSNPSNFLGERLTSVCLLIFTQGFGLGSMILRFPIFDITNSR